MGVVGVEGQTRLPHIPHVTFTLSHLLTLTLTRTLPLSFSPLKENNAYDKGQKVTAIRKLYHRALLIPLHNMDTLWSDYEEFENGMNPVLVRLQRCSVVAEIGVLFEIIGPLSVLPP